jgi:hypothetical protein
MTKTIREFLNERNLNPTDFQAVIDRFEDKANIEYKLAGLESYYSLLDVKREDDIIVVLQRCSRPQRGHGIRRDTKTTVFIKGKEVGSKMDNYVDGGQRTYHLDRPQRNFSRVIGWQRDGYNLVVNLGNEQGPTGQISFIC